jgi:predicted Zn-dependent protease
VAAARSVRGWVGVTALLACAGSGPGRGPDDDYLRWVAFEVPVNEFVLLRWPERRMPLRVHLPPPPEGYFDDPVAVLDSVRDGILDWSDVAAPGVPSFAFVERAGDADIPVVWARDAAGGWYIAFCSYDIDVMTRRFGVSHVLVTARGRDGHPADLHDVHRVMLHEMGHALGLTGHSPEPGDIMYGGGMSRSTAEGLSARDRSTLRILYSRPIGSRVVGARQYD